MTEDVEQGETVPSADSIYAALAERFPTEAHKKVKKGGREQTYIPWTDKVERLNAVLGQDWSFRVIREGLTETEAWVLGEFSVTIDGVTTVRQQYGCESITRGQGASPVTDLFKIAGTDALSKAATLFGCGLYLSIQEERAEVEAAMQEAIRAAAAEKRNANKPEPPKPAGYFCIECQGLVKADGTVTIPKKQGGPMVSVPVADFAPVVEQRLGGFHCPGCYEKKWFNAA